jgi:hypothetical protein
VSIEVTHIPQQYTQLGRQRVHDSRSKAFPARLLVDKSKWHSKTIRIYDPKRNPNQCHGECTGVAKCVQMNAVGNRVKGVTFGMDQAHAFYHLSTELDPFDGTWPPDDTGSSGLASAKAAQKLGIGGEYRHVFNGADGVVEQIMADDVVSVGTWWYEGMFNQNAQGIIEPTGPQVGGHQYAVRGYDAEDDLLIIRCWWGDFRDAKIKRTHLDELLHDGGDAHVQDRILTAPAVPA